MADTKTRLQTVQEALEAVESQRGEEAWNYITKELLKEISESLAMLVDEGSST